MESRGADLMSFFSLFIKNLQIHYNVKWLKEDHTVLVPVLAPSSISCLVYEYSANFASEGS